MNHKVAINRHKDTMRDLGRKLDSVTGNITAIDELVRQLLATKRRFQVLEEDLKLEWALEGRQHAYLQQLVLEARGHLPQGSQRQTTSIANSMAHDVQGWHQQLPPRTDQGHRSLAQARAMSAW